MRKWRLQETRGGRDNGPKIPALEYSVQERYFYPPPTRWNGSLCRSLLGEDLGAKIEEYGFHHHRWNGRSADCSE